MNTIWIVMPILIVLMFLLGIDINRKAFADIAHNPKAVLLVQNIVLLFVPLLAGSMFKHFCSGAAVKVSKVLSKMAFPALMILAAVFFLQYKTEIAANFASLGLSAALLIVVAMACSSCMSRIGKCNDAVRRTIVIEVGMHSIAARWLFRPYATHC